MRFCKKEKKNAVCNLLYRRKGHVRLAGIYRLYLGSRQGQKIFVVDGDAVCLKLYPNFIMGGNDQRYRFSPENEIWIDNRIGIEELEYTIQHELVERKLMKEKGWTYDKAHEKGGLAVEKKLRDRDALRLARKQKTVAIPGFYLTNIYRQYFGCRDGAKVWIVDGPTVRHRLYPDFCFGTHDLEHKRKFIPTDEIWLDSAMSVEIGYYALIHQVYERRLIAAGTSATEAYDRALIACYEERGRQSDLVIRHEANLAPVPYGVRERGVMPDKK